MLQNNHLHRRIQHKNLFRTFSRTYSRKSEARRLRSQNQQHIQTQPIHSTSTPYIHNNHNQTLSYNKTNAFQNTIQHFQLTSQTAPIFKRNEHLQNMETPFSNTAYLSNFRPQTTNLQKHSHNNYLNSLLEKRKESGTSTSNLSLFNRKQKFKLKSCSQAKQITFQTQTDQSDFSILQYNRKNKLKKHLQQRKQRQSQNLSRIEFLRTTSKEPMSIDLKTHVGKRIAAHLFNRYNNKIQRFINISKKEKGIISFDN